MDHARVAGIEHPKCTAITALRCLHQRKIAAARLGGGVHSRQTRESRLQLNVG